MAESEVRPLDRVTSIRTKLGLLVGISVVVSALFATLAAAGSVPWWLSIPMAVGLALAITQLLASGMTAPLREMTTAAERMSHGDYLVSVRATSSDEVGQLARAFTDMAADLRTVDQQRRDLVATVAHELRTPLAGLSAQLENMADGVTPIDLDSLGAQVDRLSALVGDLLDLSRLEAGITALDVAAVDVAELVETARETLAHAGREVTFDTRVHPGLTVYADRARLLQLLTNLLDNAARHSPAGGQVTVEAREMGTERWTLEVTDEGPGIPEAERTRVFERFGTGDPAGGGTGLGLAIGRWVADLHGGRISALDGPSGTGARFRVELPTSPATRPPRETDEPRPDVVLPDVVLKERKDMNLKEAVAHAPAPADQPSTSPWSWSTEAPPRPGVVLGAVAVGVLASILLPFRDFGLALTACLLAGGAVVVSAWWRNRDGFGIACGVLAILCALVPTLRAAEWMTVLSIFVAGVLIVAGTVRVRTFLQVIWGGLAAMVAGLVGLPWLGRSILAIRGGTNGRVLQTIALSTATLLVFGALLASGDAVLGSWTDALLPDVGSPDLVLRVFIAVAVAGCVLVAAFLGHNPPPLPGGRPRTLSTRYEWLAPVLIVDGLYVVFLVAQAAATFGGEQYLLDTTGLTYAEYVHQGFGQLTVATALTLMVIAIAAPRASRASVADRRWLRGAVGLLCLLTLAVVASAIHRMNLYQDAYGLTVLRLLVTVFEGWLGLLVLMVMVAGVSLRGGWLVRAGILSGAAAVLGLAAINADAFVARHNLDRFESGEQLDAWYLKGLSADAVPTVVEARPDDISCVLPWTDEKHDDWLEWNLGRARARAALEVLSTPVDDQVDCTAYERAVNAEHAAS